MINWRLFNILIIILLSSACSARKDLAPVIARNQPPSTKVLYHVVAPGETLYSIAWRYNLDYKMLAKANNIGSNYRIYPQQRILLNGPKKAANPRVTYQKKIIVPPSPPVKASTQVATPEKPTRLKNTPLVVKKRPPPKSSGGALAWSWPASGPILSRFNSNGGLNKGIDIGGNMGEPVRAASAGTVVYSGEGLRGYGKLIIIKHSEKYLSAYAHNHKLRVKEGDKVVQNEQIAELGKTGADRVKLHFEIRHDGKPVDPAAYLPPRK